MKHLLSLFPSFSCQARGLVAVGVALGMGLLRAGPAAAQVPTWEWAKTAGQDSYNTSTAVDSAGNVYVTGQFQDVAAFGFLRLTAAGTGAYVAKLTRTGEYQWVVPVPVPSTWSPTGLPLGIGTHVLAVDRRGNVLVLGHFDGDSAVFGSTVLMQPRDSIYGPTGFVAKLDATGQWLWARGLDDNGGNAVAQAVAVDGTGNVVITGSFAGDSATFGPLPPLSSTSSSGGGLFVAKLSPAGTWLWATSAGGSAWGTGIGADARGNVVVSGMSGDSALAVGATTLGVGLFVAKLNSAGAWQWATPRGGSGRVSCKGLALDSAGDVIIAGEFFGDSATFGSLLLTNPALSWPLYISSKLYVARLTGAGAWQWAVSAGDSTKTMVTGLTMDPHGNATVAGEFDGQPLRFGRTVVRQFGNYVAQLTPAGAWQWAVAAVGSNSSSNNRGLAVAADGRGAVYVAGTIGATATVRAVFGAIRLPRGGGYLARLSTGLLPPRPACPGDTLLLGAPAPPGTSTRWTPGRYLSSVIIAQPRFWVPARPPRADTTYVFERLTEQTAIGIRGGATGDRFTVRVLAAVTPPRLLSVSVDTLDERRVVGTFSVARATHFPSATITLEGQTPGQSFGPLAAAPLPAAGTLGTVGAPALPPGATYRLRAAGTCDSVVSGTHAPVTLAADAPDALGFTTLRWTAYRGWADAPGPVTYALLTRPDSTTAYAPTGLTPRPDTTQRVPAAAGARQFRIRALAPDGRRSASNSVTLPAAPAPPAPPDIRAYNILTPNHDGRNDAFVVDNLAAYPGTALAVYSRWGREVYRAPDYHSGAWRAEGLSAGTYFYRLTLPDGRTLKGWVEVVR